MTAHNGFGDTKCTHASLPCASCGDGVAVHTAYLTPVTLCGACTPERWDGATLPEGAVDWATILDHPCMPTRDLGSYAHLVQRIPLVELTSDAATELRARVTGRAA